MLDCQHCGIFRGVLPGGILDWEVDPVFDKTHATSWLMLLADDVHLEVGDVHFRSSSSSGAPSWVVRCCGRRLQEATTTSWAGSELLLKKSGRGLLVRPVGKTDSWFEVRPREVV